MPATLSIMELQNLSKQDKRGGVERALKLWQDRGVLRYVAPLEDGPKPLYRIVTAEGYEFEAATLVAAEALVQGLAVGARAALNAALPGDAHYVWKDQK